MIKLRYQICAECFRPFHGFWGRRIALFNRKTHERGGKRRCKEDDGI